MKRTLLAVAVIALFLPGARVAKGADVSVDFFYNNLSGGSWIEVADYGYCWQPDVVVSNTSWRPYSDGYWAYTDVGWTWVSYEDFGWAAYHYGRWARLADYGWVWVPGRDEDLEWGPAWVSWRTSDSYVGWAPLPPQTIGMVHRGAITGHLDIEFDIGPGYYNFCEVRYIGEPVLRERIVDVNQNVTFVSQTVNVTNITYKNKVVYNYGPDINVINTRASRPIQRLKLERQENVDPGVAMKSGAVTKVQGDKLVVAAPMHIRKSEKNAAPPVVKTKVGKVKLDRGWGAVGDEKAQTEFKQKIKTQDLHTIPSGNASVNAPGSPSVTGAASPAGSPGASPFEKGRGKGKHAGEETDVTGAQVGGSPASDASPAGTGAGSRKGAKRGEMPMTGGTPAGVGATTESSPAGGSMVPEGGKHKGKLDRGNAGATEEAAKGTNLNSSKSNIYQSSPPAPTTAPLGAGEGTMQPGDQGQGGKHKGRQFDQPAGPQGAQGIQPTGDAEGAAETGRGRQKPKEVQPNYIQGGAPPATGAEGPGKGQGRGQGKKPQGDASPVPSPQ